MTARPYERLGAFLTKLARERRASTPRTIAKCLEEATGYRVTRRTVSRYLHGTRCPAPEFMHAFAETFSLTPQERRQLAWMYAFSELPN